MSKNMTKMQSEPKAAATGSGDGCPRCDEPTPKPLPNFCTQCGYPFRTDSEERGEQAKREGKRGHGNRS